jgi:hypothetical protein
MTKLARWVTCAGLAAAMLTWMAVGGVRADDEAKEEVKAKVSGKILIVGPDGKRQEFDFGDKLPKEMRERIQQHMKKLDLKQLPKGDRCVDGKITIVGPDGKKREIKLGGDHEKCPGAKCEVRVLKSGGKVIVVGPDGKRREHSFGDAKDEKKPSESREAKGDDSKADKKDEPQTRVIQMGRVIVVGPDGKRREFDMGQIPKIDLDQLLPKDLDLPEEVEKMIREQLKSIELPRVRERLVPKRDESPKINQMQRQIKEMQKQIDELKKRLEEKKKDTA